MRFVLLCLFLAGCGASVAYSPLNAPPHAMTARTPESVEVVAAPPARPFVEVGSLEVPQQGDTDSTEVARKLRFDAAERGCDALIMITATAPGAAGLRATCIVYRDSGPGPEPKAMQEAPQHGGY